MIHQFQLNGYNIVIDVYSGAVHVVDALVYDLIGLYETANREDLVSTLCDKYTGDTTKADVLEALSAVDALKNAGKLFSPDTYKALAENLTTKKSVIKALCLHVSHACNLACAYCFAGAGRYHGASALMNFNVGKRAIDFLVEQSGARRNLEVDFFGGEPLLNWDVVKQIVAYARSLEQVAGKNFRFTLTTNGVLIDDDVIDFCNREMHNVVLSLDGRKETHDRFRKSPDGGGSYDTVVPKFQRFVKERGNKNYYIRGTFTHDNTDFTKDILHMANLGFSELSMEPVVSKQEDAIALTENDMPVLLEQYEALAYEMLRRDQEGCGFTFYHFLLDLNGGPCIYKRISGCGAGTEYAAVTPEGTLYPCHQFVGDKDYVLGDIWRGIKNDQKREAFARCNAYTREACQACWARLYCSGGCAANAYHASGSIEGVYEDGCRLFKKRIECAVMMKVARALGR
ncbi:thioether cross-link-forming SCIFF peptide maturase [Oscillospiraceae bacterium CM]|nr:thioether cross-link-forming SCIFF peptide maturase [Oscillospiraceae bacterium CM]